MTVFVITVFASIYFAVNAILNQPHGIIEISNVNPRNPKIIINEEIDSMVPISISRIGGCKYAAEIGFKCLERTAKDGLDFKCNYQRLKWKDGECDQKVVYITVYNDDEYEQDEEFLFQLYSLPDNIALGFDRVLIVIQQNDVSYGEIRIYPTFVSVVEGMSFQLEIKRMFGKTNQARVCYQLISGTAKINFDVTFIQDCIEWEHDDDETHLITVDTIHDNLWEGNETFYVKLSNVEGAQLNNQYVQTNITILQNNVNVPLIASTFPPCLESKKEIQIDPTKGEEQFFVQFEVSLPKLCTVNDAHIIAEHVTESQTSLKWIVFKIHGIIMDETTVSCDNIPASYNIITNNKEKNEIDCNSIINKTVIVDNHINYTCNLTAECMNFDPVRNHPKYINVNTTLTARKQRLLCQDVITNTNNISCQCDFPMIYDSDEWLISNLSFGSKYVSNSVGLDIFEMTQQTLWNNHSLATFIFIIKGYGKDENIAVDSDPTTNWIFYLVTDAFPCQPSNWSEWSICDAKPVGIGHMYRHRMSVHGISGQELMCNELKQHQMCVVNQDKTVSFSRQKIRVQEGDDSATITIRLNHELTSNKTVNESKLSIDELNILMGYDVIIYFEIPQFYRKEIVIDPMRIGWYRDKWDIVHQIKITALDDSNIDALEQTIVITPKIYSIDTDYNELEINILTIIVEDNEKCRYCGVGDIQPFNPAPKSPFWDFKSILILVSFLLMIMFVLWRLYIWFKSKYGVRNEYDKLQQDGLMDESKSTVNDSVHSASVDDDNDADDNDADDNDADDNDADDNDADDNDADDNDADDADDDNDASVLDDSQKT